MGPHIDHIHITVEDLDRAEAYYDRLLPPLGFDLSLKEHDAVQEHAYRIVEYHSRAFHRPGQPAGGIPFGAAKQAEGRRPAPPGFPCGRTGRGGPPL